MATMDEAGRLVANLAAVVPQGLVAFAPSFAYCEQLLQRWEASGLLPQLSARKKFFRWAALALAGGGELGSAMWHVARRMWHVIFAVLHGTACYGHSLPMVHASNGMLSAIHGYVSTVAGVAHMMLSTCRVQQAALMPPDTPNQWAVLTAGSRAVLLR